ncbi:MAG: hypothetical protein HWN66_09185 [Candidatus Helarchaeota archaeon]|nr:hypothetical protein [Candidatus Helarchaeota archaeon]
MKISVDRTTILEITYAVLIILEFVVIGLYWIIRFYESVELTLSLFLIIFGTFIITIAYLASIIDLQYETEENFNTIVLAQEAGWFLCLIGSIIVFFNIAFPDLLISLFALLVTIGLILCGIFLFPRLKKEKDIRNKNQKMPK